uniref:ANK_REP_REGION domain-containing protein n=1 Tax=Wuchereria bancrofti TaxID=6293 RepID=A0A1I8ER75_WUCBA
MSYNEKYKRYIEKSYFYWMLQDAMILVHLIEILQRIIASCGTKIINCKDFDGRESTPLHFAAGYNRVEVLKYLLRKGANVEARVVMQELRTPLHEAALKEKFDVCKLLIISGADLKHKGRDGKTPLDAVREGAEDAYNLLHDDAAVLETFGPLLKHWFASADYLEVARFLLENGAEVNLKDKDDLIPLHNASSFGHLEIAALLMPK